MYADDTQMYIPFDEGTSEEALRRLELCIAEIRRWLSKNFLKLNDEKTEFLVIGKPHVVKNMKNGGSIMIGETQVRTSTSARNIGAVVDSTLNMADQVNSVSKACYLSLRHISQIRPYLTEDATATLVNALITSKLDNLNCLLYGLPAYMLKRLQLIQNNAGRLVTKTKKMDNITPILKRLHWLPVKYRIDYKMLLLCYKALNGAAPTYLTALLHPYVPSRELRSSSKNLLVEPPARLKHYGERAFAVAAPKLWNSLPEALKCCDSVHSFKTGLKTHLFKQSFKE
jgi:hypothetical protein